MKKFDMAKTLIESHLYRHMEYAVFACTICDYKGNYIREHVKNSHKVDHAPFLDYRANFEKELISLISKCFPVETLKRNRMVNTFSNQTNQQLESWDKLQNEVKAMCKAKSGRVFKCSICKRLKDQSSVCNHVLWHLAKPVFFCDYCSFKGCLIERHQRKIHKYLKPSFKSFCHLYKSEILRIAKDCFGKSKTEKLATNRLLLSGLLKKLKVVLQNHHFAQCSKCTDRGKYTVSRLQQHAMWHLGRSLFSCNLCNYHGCTMNKHLNSEHNILVKKIWNLENSVYCTDNRIEWFDEFSTMLQECFLRNSSFTSEIKQESANETVVNVELEEFHKDEKRAVDMSRSLESSLYEEYITELDRMELQLTSSQKPDKYMKYLKHIVEALKTEFVKCNLCNSSLQARDYVLNDHITTHISPSTELYQCGKCSIGFPTKSKLRTHVQNHHLSTSTRGYFVDLRYKHQKELISLLNKCFFESEECKTGHSSAYITDNHLKPTLLSKVFLLDFKKKICHGTAQKYILCSKCGRKLNVNIKSLEGHVMTHAHVDAYSCKKCEFKACTKEKMLKHFKGAHRESSYSVSLVEDIRFLHDDKILSAAKACFENTELVSPEVKPHLFLNEITIITAKFNKEKPKGKVQCNVCKQPVCVDRTSLTSHVYNHISKPLFKCMVCGFEVIGKSGSVHMKTKHPSAPISELQDQRYLIDKDLKDMVEMCFGKTNEANLHLVSINRHKKKISEIPTQTPIEKRKTQFDPMMSRIVTRLNRKNRLNITCKECNVKLTVSQFSGHVLKHLHVPIYQCSHCNWKDFNVSGIKWHIMKTDACSQAIVVDLRQKHDVEMVNCLKKCFGKLPDVEKVFRKHDGSLKRKPKPRTKKINGQWHVSSTARSASVHAENQVLGSNIKAEQSICTESAVKPDETSSVMVVGGESIEPERIEDCVSSLTLLQSLGCTDMKIETIGD